MPVITMYHKDGRTIPVNDNQDSISRMKNNGFYTKKTAPKKPAKKAE